MGQTVRKMRAEPAMLVNTSGLEPLGHAVLVAPYEPEVAKSPIMLPDTVADRTKMVATRVTVIAIGAEAWREESVPRAKVGDKVMITKFAGEMTVGPKDGKQYRVVNDRDLYVRITEEA